MTSLASLQFQLSRTLSLFTILIFYRAYFCIHFDLNMIYLDHGCFGTSVRFAPRRVPPSAHPHPGSAPPLPVGPSIPAPSVLTVHCFRCGEFSLSLSWGPRRGQSFPVPILYSIPVDPASAFRRLQEDLQVAMVTAVVTGGQNTPVLPHSCNHVQPGLDKCRHV